MDESGNRTAAARTRVRIETVSPAHAGRRVDNVVLSLLKGAPRSLAYKLLRSGQIRVNGKRARPEHRVAAGDRIRIPPVEPATGGPAAIPAARLAQLEQAIVFEDAHALVIDKPAGLACHAGTGSRYGVIDILRKLRPHCERLDLAHRIDRDTSGCLLLCKDLPTLHAAQAAWRSGAADKHYVALVRGHLPAELEVIEAALDIERSGGERRAVAATGGKRARTVIEARRAVGPHTEITFRLDTGRMHQIRAHARHIGHPLAGDRHYGDKGFNREMRGLGLRRLFLHAAALRLKTTELDIDVRLPLPAELTSPLARLEAAS